MSRLYKVSCSNMHGVAIVLAWLELFSKTFVLRYAEGEKFICFYNT